MTTEPTTQSGRAHMTGVVMDGGTVYGGTRESWAKAITAIEREARAALLDELEAAVRELEFAPCGGYGCAGERAEDREQLFTLIQQHRETT